jgi:hypothetical protein
MVNIDFQTTAQSPVRKMYISYYRKKESLKFAQNFPNIPVFFRLASAFVTKDTIRGKLAALVVNHFKPRPPFMSLQILLFL